MVELKAYSENGIEIEAKNCFIFVTYIMVQSKKHTQKILRDKSDKSFYLGNICNIRVDRV